jgi:hypothetical protein
MLTRTQASKQFWIQVLVNHRGVLERDDADFVPANSQDSQASVWRLTTLGRVLVGGPRPFFHALARIEVAGSASLRVHHNKVAALFVSCGLRRAELEFGLLLCG